MRRILLINPHRTIEIQIPLFGRIKFKEVNSQKIRGRSYKGVVIDEKS